MHSLVENYGTFPTRVRYDLEMRSVDSRDRFSIDEQMEIVARNFEVLGVTFREDEVRSRLAEMTAAPKRMSMRVEGDLPDIYRLTVDEFLITSRQTGLLEWAPSRTEYIQGSEKNWEVGGNGSHAFEFPSSKPITHVPHYSVVANSALMWFLDLKPLDTFMKYPYDWRVEFDQERVVATAQSDAIGAARIIRAVFASPDLVRPKLLSVDMVFRLESGSWLQKSFKLSDWGRHPEVWRPGAIRLDEWRLTDPIDEESVERLKRDVRPSLSRIVEITRFEANPDFSAELFEYTPSPETLVSVTSTSGQVTGARSQAQFPERALRPSPQRDVVGAKRPNRWPTYVSFAGGFLFISAILYHFLRRR